MFEIERRTSLPEMTSSVVGTAIGSLKADIVIRNASLVNVNSLEGWLDYF